ncbi:MAG: efflux RND transporter permease subunit [Chloroflexi bacterium]|nr:MAG: efflux RND transporter permease subunit [Chloroflexota bacterium]
MMRWIVASSMHLRYLIVVIAAAVMAVGVAQLRTMPVDVLPEFAPPYVEIQAEALGLSAPEVENLVTLDVEELEAGVSWVKTIRSTSVPGMSSVVLIFEPGTDFMRARQLTAERLTQTFVLPNVFQSLGLLPPKSATSRVLLVGLSSKTLSPIEMGVLTQWTIRPALLAVPGVANISVWGQRDRQLQVLVDQARLRKYGVKIDSVVENTGNAMFVSLLSFLQASYPGTGGFFDTPQQRFEVRHVLPISTAAELAQVPVYEQKKDDGSPLLLGDLGRVVEGHQPLIGDAVLRGGPGYLVVVEKLPWSNTLDVTRAVDEKLNTLRGGLPGVNIDSTVFRPASFIRTAIGHYGRALLLGALLLIAVLLIFLGHWRPTLAGAVAILTSLAAALFVLHLRGETLNVMLLTGLMIAIGVIVDVVVVGVENILQRVRRLPADGDGRVLPAVVLDASVEMQGVLLFAALILLLAMVPVLFIEDVLGAFLRPLAVSYLLAVGASAVVALTLTPALSLLLLSGATPGRGEPGLILWLRRGYERMLAWTMRRSTTIFAAAGVIALAGLAVLPSFSPELLPPFKEPYLMIQLEAPPATSRPEMERIITRIGREVQAVPGVRNFGAHFGRAVTGDQAVGINSATLWVSLDPSVDHDAGVAAIQKTLGGYPGLAHRVETYTEHSLKQVLTGSNDDMVVRLYGPEWNVLRSKAEDVRQAISGIGGVVGLHKERLVEEPQVEIELDLARAARYGLTPGDVRRQAATLMNGIQAGQLYQGQEMFNVVVWSVPEARRSLTSIRNLLLDTPNGAGPRSRLHRARRQARAPGRRVPAGAPGGAARGVRAAAGGPAAHAHRRGGRGDRDLPPAAGGVPKLAPGGADPADVACRPGGRRAGGGRRRGDPLARRARRIPGSGGHRCAHRHDADRPPSAPRRAGGRSRWTGACPARVLRAAGPDLDDRAGDGTDLRAVRGLRQHPWARDRASDGVRGTGRPCDLDVGYPVRCPPAVRTLRRGERRACARPSPGRRRRAIGNRMTEHPLRPDKEEPE